MNKQTLALIVLVLLWLFFLIVIIQHESLQVSENSVYLNYLSRGKTTLWSKEPGLTCSQVRNFKGICDTPGCFLGFYLPVHSPWVTTGFIWPISCLHWKSCGQAGKKTQNIFFILLKSLKFIQVLLIASDSIITEQQQQKKKKKTTQER